MFSSSQTETLSTDSTEQIQGRMSHKAYEKKYRRPNGQKRYEKTIAERMAAKKAERMAKKFCQQPMEAIEVTAGETTVTLQYPGSLPTLQGKVNLNDPSLEIILGDNHLTAPVASEEAMIQYHTDMYGNTAVITKKFGPRTVVVNFPEPGKTAPRFREVWQLEDGKMPRLLKASYGNKSSIVTLEESDWKWMILKDFPDLIRHLAGLPPIDKP